MTIRSFSSGDLTGVDAKEFIGLIDDCEIIHHQNGRGLIVSSVDSTNRNDINIVVDFAGRLPIKKYSFLTLCSKPGFELLTRESSDLFHALQIQIDLVKKKQRLRQERIEQQTKMLTKWKQAKEESLAGHITAITALVKPFFDSVIVARAHAALETHIKNDLSKAVVEAEQQIKRSSSVDALLGVEAIEEAQTLKRTVEPLKDWHLSRNFGVLSSVTRNLRLGGYQVLGAALALYDYSDRLLIEDEWRRASAISASNSLIELGFAAEANRRIRQVIGIEESSCGMGSKFSLLVLYKLLRRYPDFQRRDEEQTDLYNDLLKNGWIRGEDDLEKSKVPIFYLTELGEYL